MEKTITLSDGQAKILAAIQARRDAVVQEYGAALTIAVAGHVDVTGDVSVVGIDGASVTISMPDVLGATKKDTDRKRT